MVSSITFHFHLTHEGLNSNEQVLGGVLWIDMVVILNGFVGDILFGFCSSAFFGRSLVGRGRNCSLSIKLLAVVLLDVVWSAFVG